MGCCGSSNSKLKDNDTYIQAPPAALQKPVISEIEYQVEMHGAPEKILFVASYPNIKIKEGNKVVREWPLKFIRGYGQVGDIFSFETGRSVPEGARVYYLKVMDKKDIFVGLNQVVAAHTDDGRGANRYLNHEKPPPVSESEYATLSRGQGLSQETYDQMAQLSENFYDHIGQTLQKKSESGYDVAAHRSTQYDVAIEYNNPSLQAPVYDVSYDQYNDYNDGQAPVYDTTTDYSGGSTSDNTYNSMVR